MQRKKGISLIVLVITIIVMIVLAGAIIITLNNSGIIQKANEAVDKTNEAQVQQIAQLGWAEAYAEYGDNVDKLTKGVEDALTANGINPDDYEITVTKTGVTLTKAEKVELVETEVPAEWKTNVAKIINGVPIPNGFVASSVKGETIKDTGLVIYEGEEAVTKANHYDALRTRNQYVWVPVPDFSKFVRRTFGENVNLVNTIGGDVYGFSGDCWEIVLDENNMPTDTRTGKAIYNEYTSYDITITEEELATIKAMYASVKKYGGFYIARYEIGKGSVSVMNAIPNLDYGTISQQYISRNAVTETLIYGVQWDTTIQWILDSELILTGYSILQELSLDDLNEGAKYGKYRADCDSCTDAMGYYCCSDRRITAFQPITSGKNEGVEWYLTTGALKSAKQNNIYDMQGNYSEITGERFAAYYDSVYVIRNGTSRDTDAIRWSDSGVWDMATRSALYINN